MRIINKELIKDYAFEMNRKPEPDTLAFQIKKGYKAKEVQVKMETDWLEQVFIQELVVLLSIC